MKFTVSTSELQSKLTIVNKVILKKNMLKILDSAMVSQVDGAFFLTGASTENQITVGLDMTQVSQDEFSPFCVDVSQFLAMLGTLPGQTIEIDVDKDNGYLTMVRYDGGDFSLHSHPAVDFPVKNKLGEEDTNVAFSIPAAVLLPHIKAVKVCTCDDDFRPFSSAVAVDVSHEGVTFVGTDTNKLCRISYSHGVPFLSQGNPSIILFPRSLVAALDAVIGKSENVAVRANDKTIEVSVDNAALLGTTIHAKYPDYNRVIPNESKYHVKIAVDDLVMSIKRASLMSDISTELIILAKERDSLTICASDILGGKSSTARLSADECTLPDGFRIGIKSSGLLALLGNISTKDVYICFSGVDKAMVIKEAAENSAIVELIMPMTTGAV